MPEPGSACDVERALCQPAIPAQGLARPCCFGLRLGLLVALLRHADVHLLGCHVVAGLRQGAHVALLLALLCDVVLKALERPDGRLALFALLVSAAGHRHAHDDRHKLGEGVLQVSADRPLARVVRVVDGREPARDLVRGVLADLLAVVRALLRQAVVRGAVVVGGVRPRLRVCEVAGLAPPRRVQVEVAEVALVARAAPAAGRRVPQLPEHLLAELLLQVPLGKAHPGHLELGARQGRAPDFDRVALDSINNGGVCAGYRGGAPVLDQNHSGEQRGEEQDHAA
mmetsp:Transcript_37594/g.106184  ORF Transcript_37594/g.106184 Transcript_37594/m.106184 type:complete len:284 (-) Transcript_37594:214-1065(-)